MAAPQTDHGLLRKGCSGLPSRYKIDLRGAVIDSDRGTTLCEVSDTQGICCLARGWTDHAAKTAGGAQAAEGPTDTASVIQVM